MGVFDTNIRLNFPNRHPLNVTGTSAVEEADCVLFIDVKDYGKPTQRLDSSTREISSRLAPETVILDIGFNDLGISPWSHDFAQLQEVDIQITADTSIALPQLLQLCRERTDGEGQGRRTKWGERCALIHEEAWRSWETEAARSRDLSPVATSRMAAEVWAVIQDHDWVLTAGTASDWALRTWDFDKPYRHPGRSLGTATQISISLGVALAHRDRGRLVVDLQPDGDLMFDAGALWVAAAYRIPLLVVMFNNRAYYNDWAHQERMARLRGTAVENAAIGMEIADPAPDFAAVARGFGWHSEGPITDPDAVGEAVSRAAEVVSTTGRPALVDVVCQYR